MHAGHLKLASDAMSELNLDRIYFVPSYKTPLKNNAQMMPWAGRVERLRKTLKKYPGFSVCLCEIRRKGASYTVDTLKFFKKKFGKKSALYFLSGADTLRNFRRWKAPAEIMKLSRFVVFSRPGFGLMKQALPEGALYVPMDALAISSTQIRSKNKIERSS